MLNMAQQMKHFKTSLETTDDGNEDNYRQQSQIYAKDSLDRFGDDFCALLLSYLSLEDRFRLECVSKQFQRTVFESVVDITFSDEFIKRLSKEKRSAIEMVAIKCANIQTIDCQEIDIIYKQHIPEVLTTFRDNCRHLSDIYCNLSVNSNQLLPTFGPLITRIEIIYPKDKQLLIHCHRLSQLNINSLSEVFDSTSQLLVKNLHKFVFMYESTDNKEQLSAFVAHNQSLTSLGVWSDETSPEMCEQLSQLTQLRELRVNFGIMSGENSLSESLRTIGVNCKQLQRLSLLLMYSTNLPLNLKTLDSLRCYHILKRLRLVVYKPIDRQLLEPLKLCHRLTHLTLFLKQMIYKLPDNCNKHWPRLQYLSISAHDIHRECLDHISRLPALQMLIIECNASKGNHMKHKKTSLEITDEGIEDNKQQTQIYAKNSMDRFGDDLCALIVSYLSFEDRFQLECVSKQFQRTVFGSVVDITLSDRFIHKFINENKIDTNFIIGTLLLATIAIKCPHIQSIDCRGISAEYEKHIPEVLNIFRDNCRHLRQIYCNLWPNSEHLMYTLGPLVTRIGCIESMSESDSLIHLHRLSRLLAVSFNDIFGNSNDSLLVHNLHTFELKEYSDSDIHRLSAFVAQNLSLRSVTFTTTDTMTGLSAQLSRLTQLRELTEMSDKLLDNCEKHWPRLQYLSIKARIMIRECLDRISRLPALQMLVIESHKL
ncbi:unnamed protein product [Medioppia subpectinata]|uniref:F-box domain-containing protein n=1 Tax=Medioppia subpectinata TaxID=1979941 RepID=A0A7R9KGG3_9ACAR|nr:unnamed protein product [Medioppia subpectinata]CAG2102898.1 unnamed protein product [Medioppia subpectinata]